MARFGRPPFTFRAPRAVLLAGFAVIVVGVMCLYLSDAVAGTGSWWQATLDAFGVGFIVGGVIDVLAISGLNQVIAGEQKRRENNLEAQLILRSSVEPVGKASAAEALLALSDGQIDGSLRDQLEELIQLAREQRAQREGQADL